MNEYHWRCVQNINIDDHKLSQWLHDLLNIPYNDLLVLFNGKTILDDGIEMPNIEETFVKQDYLDFLQEQVKLKPRGEDWNKILSMRLAKLKPYVNKKIINASFKKKEIVINISIDITDHKIIDVERHE